MSTELYQIGRSTLLPMPRRSSFSLLVLTTMAINLYIMILLALLNASHLLVFLRVVATHMLSVERIFNQSCSRSANMTRPEQLQSIEHSRKNVERQHRICGGCRQRAEIQAMHQRRCQKRDCRRHQRYWAKLESLQPIQSKYTVVVVVSSGIAAAAMLVQLTNYFACLVRINFLKLVFWKSLQCLKNFTSLKHAAALSANIIINAERSKARLESKRIIVRQLSFPFKLLENSPYANRMDPRLLFLSHLRKCNGNSPYRALGRRMGLG
eukprot:284815058_6